MSKITNPWKLAEKSSKKCQERSSSRQSHPFLAQDPEAVVGQFHDLPVENFSDYGVYLSFGRDRVLLPNKYVPEDIFVGEKIRVFIHTDSEDRPVATTLEPAGVVGDIVALKVKTRLSSASSWTGAWKKTYHRSTRPPQARLSTPGACCSVRPSIYLSSYLYYPPPRPGGYRIIIDCFIVLFGRGNAVRIDILG